MRLIPRNTKVRTSFYKGVTVADVSLGLVGLGLAALAVASNLPYRLFIALGIACLFIPLFIPVGEERIYKCALYLARHIFSRKKYTKKGKDAANIQSIIPYERIDGNCIVNKDGGFTGVLEIKPVEFRLLGANKQNYLIDGVLSLLPTDAVYYFTQASVRRARPAGELRELASRHGLEGEAYPDVVSAFHAAMHDASADDFIFVGGSSFVVADLLAAGK